MPLGVKYDKPVDIAIDSTGIKAFNRGSGRSGHITGSSNRWLRRNMIECARAAVRNDQHLEGFYLKLKRKRGGEKKALIAVSRNMVTYAYWMLKRNLTYEELSPWV